MKLNKTNSVLLLALLLVLAGVAILMVRLFVRESGGITVEDAVHQFFLTSETALSAGDRIDLRENGIVFRVDGETVVGEDTPIYYDNKTVFILPRDYSWIDLNSGREWFVPALSSVEVDGQGNVWCKVEGEPIALSGGFMTDCYHTFVFLTDTDISVNGEMIPAGPLSFFSSADGMIRVYDYTTGTMSDYPSASVQGDSSAVLSGCRLNLTTFVLIDRNGDPRMLVSSPSVLKSLKEK